MCTRGTRCTRISRATEAWTHSANTIKPGEEVIGVARLAVMFASGSISVSVYSPVNEPSNEPGVLQCNGQQLNELSNYCSNILFVEADFTLQWNREEYGIIQQARIQQAHYNMLHTDVAL